MSVIISDTSPIRALAFLGCVDWLAEVFEEVFVPPAVAWELANPRDSNSPLVDLTTFDFIHVRAPVDTHRIKELTRLLNPGEAEAIALALEHEDVTLLIDERRGRQIAEGYGINATGTVGVLIAAHELGLTDRIAPLLVRLRGELRFFLTDTVVAKALRRTGELDDAD